MTVNWFVPCRRGAVTASLDYLALIDGWIEQLETYAARLSQWYGLSELQIAVGIDAIRMWRGSFFPEGLTIHALRDGEVTLDSGALHFKPRLWKGPHRVLLEAAAGPEEPGETIFDPLTTEIPRLVLSAAREIDNPDAELLVGDVVEMPLFRFLVAAGRGEYGRYAFDPDGSYLLGTSLEASGIEDPPLHDNRAAMHLQVLLHGMVGAFYHGAPVSRHPRAVSAAVSGAAPPKPPPKDEALEELIHEVRRVYTMIAPGPNNLLATVLAAHPGTAWANVDPKIAGKLWQHTQEDHEGHPPPRVFIYWIMEGFKPLRGKKSLTEAQQIAADLLQSVHEHAITALSNWALELEELVESDLWKRHDHIGGSFKSQKADLKLALSLKRPCKRFCRDEHERTAFSRLALALRKKLAALEAFAAGGGPTPGSEKNAPRIYARGMIYAGVLYPAGSKRYYEGVPAWHYYSNTWCRDSKGDIPYCLPTAEGMGLLPKDQPITPGSSCSDTALLLLNYMIGNHGASSGAWGSASVGNTMRSAGDGEHYPIHDHYEYLWPEDIAALAPRVGREEQLAALDVLLAQLSDLERRSAKKTGFWHPIVARATQSPGWKELKKSLRDKLTKATDRKEDGWLPPVWLLRHLSQALKKYDGEAFQLLCEIHDALIEEARAFGDDLYQLTMTDPVWRPFATVGPDIKTEYRDRIELLRSIPAGGFIGRYEGNHDPARQIGRAFHYIHPKLTKKRVALEKIAAKRDKIEDAVGGVRDMTVELGDVNVVSLTSHEWCVVRLRKAEALMESSALPRAGFLTAFHPLSGQPYADATCGKDGQLFVFEQSATLKREKKNDRTTRFFDAAPFWFEKIPDNLFEIQLSGKGVCFRNLARSDSRALKGVTRLRSAQAMAALLAEGPGRPMLVHPTTKPVPNDLRTLRRSAEARMVTHGPMMYASRAVPFPTLDESRGAFATWQEAAAARKAFGPSAP